MKKNLLGGPFLGKLLKHLPKWHGNGFKDDPLRAWIFCDSWQKLQKTLMFTILYKPKSDIHTRRCTYKAYTEYMTSQYTQNQCNVIYALLYNNIYYT